MAQLSIRSRYSLIILLIAIAILALGIVFRPRKQAQARQLSESDLARLQQLAQRHQLEQLSDYLSDAADRAATRLLYLKQPPYTAVFWDVEGKAITSHRAGGDADVAAVNSRGDAFRIVRVPAPAGAPVELFAVPAGDRPAVATPSDAPATTAGDWVIAVARNSEGEPIFAQGLYQGVSPSRCGGFEYRQVDSSAPLSPALAGGGLFSMEGDLLGMIADCHGRLIVIDCGSLQALLRQPVPLNEQLLQAYGMGVAEAPDGQGVQVLSVWSGGSAEAAGVRPGDLLATADGKPISAVPDLTLLVDQTARAEHAIVIFRRKQQVILRLSESAHPVLSPGIEADGFTLGYAPNRAAVLVRETAADSRAAAAGIRAGDQLMAIDGSPVYTPEDAVRLLAKRGRTPSTLTIQRDGSEAHVLVIHE